ncbi:hypothetical protein A3709_00270 [Halioglobus sp. HI00S01]|uniref:ATP-binding protein n=1 Tax=Halioglobus sp. HI00S01 TaxID=1822214 RepID=UPI0007C3EEF9|nr:ATP-binding protein [Halioglobus sp. HI00S01]KZX60545.1 hypothetical protein A3709_00270 [Halioglobus sp. HI00S01]
MERLTFSLRRQLIVVALLLLTLPWAGCQFVREMEGALRHGQAQTLQATAQAVAAVVGADTQIIYPYPDRLSAPAEERPSVHAHPATLPIAIDGYAEGWEETPALTLQSQNTELALSIKALTRDDRLLLLVQVKDNEVVYHNPGLSPEPNGDRLVIRTWQADWRQDYVIATAAPGSVRARAASRRTRGMDPGKIRGYWQDAVDGYTIEVEMPMAMTGGRLGLYINDVGHGEGRNVVTLGNIRPLRASSPPWLIYTSDNLQAALSLFDKQQVNIQVVDRDGWQLASAGAISHRADGNTFWLVRLLYRSILAEETLPVPPQSETPGKAPPAVIEEALAGTAENLRFRDPRNANRNLLLATAPVEGAEQPIGAVIVSQSGEQYLSLTDQAFSRLLGYSLLALGTGVLGLLGYASVLSFRIGRLNRAAHTVIANDGSIQGVFPRSRAQDEIGELSRAYADLLAKLREYNDYLRTLSRKLAHELRTPIAVIQSSLENLEHTDASPQQHQTYQLRAREGLDRLKAILTAMSEANRLEESVRSNPRRDLDLVPFLQEISAAYADVHSGHTVRFETGSEQANICAAPELLAQALDKLLDNAASFAPLQTPIVIRLEAADDHWRIAISNEGPPLPNELRDRLFEPMVSLRKGDAGEVHLGLGLHVVRLIAEYHEGRVFADNVAGGVRFTLSLPGDGG